MPETSCRPARATMPRFRDPSQRCGGHGPGTGRLRFRILSATLSTHSSPALRRAPPYAVNSRPGGQRGRNAAGRRAGEIALPSVHRSPLPTLRVSHRVERRCPGELHSGGVSRVTVMPTCSASAAGFSRSTASSAASSSSGVNGDDETTGCCVYGHESLV
jgi:hypothetical protein